MWNSLMTLKYRQGHRQSYRRKAVVWFLISNFNFCERIVYNFRDIERGNDNIYRLKWPSNVIQGHRTWYQSKARIWVAIMGNFRLFTHCFTHTTSCFNAENHIFVYPTRIWPWIWRSFRWNITNEIWRLHCGHSPWVRHTDRRAYLRWLRPRYA